MLVTFLTLALSLFMQCLQIQSTFFFYYLPFPQTSFEIELFNVSSVCDVPELPSPLSPARLQADATRT